MSPARGCSFDASGIDAPPMKDETSGAVIDELNGVGSAKPVAVCDDDDGEDVKDGDSVSPDCDCFLLPVTRSQNDMMLMNRPEMMLIRMCAIRNVHGDESESAPSQKSGPVSNFDVIRKPTSNWPSGCHVFCRTDLKFHKTSPVHNYDRSISAKRYHEDGLNL